MPLNFRCSVAARPAVAGAAEVGHATPSPEFLPTCAIAGTPDPANPLDDRVPLLGSLFGGANMTPLSFLRQGDLAPPDGPGATATETSSFQESFSIVNTTDAPQALTFGTFDEDNPSRAILGPGDSFARTLAQGVFVDDPADERAANRTDFDCLGRPAACGDNLGTTGGFPNQTTFTVDFTPGPSREIGIFFDGTVTLRRAGEPTAVPAPAPWLPALAGVFGVAAPRRAR